MVAPCQYSIDCCICMVVNAFRRTLSWEENPLRVSYNLVYFLHTVRNIVEMNFIDTGSTPIIRKRRAQESILPRTDNFLHFLLLLTSMRQTRQNLSTECQLHKELNNSLYMEPLVLQKAQACEKRFQFSTISYQSFSGMRQSILCTSITTRRSWNVVPEMFTYMR